MKRQLEAVQELPQTKSFLPSISNQLTQKSKLSDLASNNANIVNGSSKKASQIMDKEINYAKEVFNDVTKLEQKL